ncbi:hypothetical protein BSL78_29054 [Apostichopus japonicus]|uniref:Uncharacterized protein n=1 Tax=Stichopus japonicus TaxID=307972 RepID=A0A2G8JEF7_STIJA|nr:hypothetical protein BSL78_29054 [Apostichopus japonicus]
MSRHWAFRESLLKTSPSKATDFLLELPLCESYSIMMDPEIFPEPEKLKPERFLDAEGNYHRPKELFRLEWVCVPVLVNN